MKKGAKEVFQKSKSPIFHVEKWGFVIDVGPQGLEPRTNRL